MIARVVQYVASTLAWPRGGGNVSTLKRVRTSSPGRNQCPHNQCPRRRLELQCTNTVINKRSDRIRFRKFLLRLDSDVFHVTREDVYDRKRNIQTKDE